MINRNIGESIHITDGAEITPQVTVTRYFMPGSMNNRDKSFEIIQEDVRGKPQRVILSPQTLKAILQWGEEKPGS